MHIEANRLMTKHLERVSWAAASVLDVGSLDLNGSYRGLVENRGWVYTGLDVRDGPNVDVVGEPWYYPFEDGAFDVVISGSTMEHVAAIWLWVPELVRILRAGGLLVVVAPHTWHEHRHPTDYWRIFPQGMKYLFGATESLERCQFEKCGTDTVGSGFKRI